MLKIRELDEMNQLTGLLAKTLALPVGQQMPPDVATALRAAQKQMEGLPEVIEDLNLAFNRYLTLNKALTRMLALAEESAAAGEAAADDARRADFEEEFVNLARIVAQEAGHRYFQGPGLTVSHRLGAVASVKVLSYLKPVLENLAHELNGQKFLIIEAITETMNFMGVIARCYPEAEGVEAIRETLGRVKLPKAIEHQITLAPTLH
jgi:Asp-tRNA(Asn)/Glu-tRNA(Gln) amidotransferase A subunit family amidase